MTQDTALDILKIGVNVFLTGEPGSGKTHTINRYIDYLRRHRIEPAVTASTGIAATHVGGYTIHSWSGIGARDDLSEWELEELTQKEAVVKRVNSTDVLIIEEISMIDARLLDTVDEVLRALRRSDKPFGGMQIVLVGDFFQLPPVSRDPGSYFAFRSQAWRDFNPVVCYLTDQYRQEDPVFLDVLSSLRHKKVLDKHIETLKDRVVEDTTEVGIDVTKLYSHNADVDRINEGELAKLDSEQKKFEMSAEGRKNLVEGLKRGCLSPDNLTLKVGAVVMFTKNNFEVGFVNGTIGKVISFKGGLPVVETVSDSDGEKEKIEVEPMEWTVEDQGKVRAKITQIPLRLAWAITVHKSQGMSLDRAKVDLSKAFEYGQGYVALSRVRTLKGLYLEGFNDRALEVHPDVAERDKAFRKRSEAGERRFSELSLNEIKDRHEDFLKSIGGSLKESPVEKRSQVAKSSKGDSQIKTLQFLKEGMSISEIAKERGLTQSTIFSHIEKLAQAGDVESDDFQHLWGETDHSKEDLEQIHQMFNELDTVKLTPVMKKLNGRYTYDELRLARMLM